MDARTFFGLRHEPAATRWSLPVVPTLCTGGGFLFGGCALGAAIEAMEAETGRPVRWATAQYLDYARPPATMDIEVNIAVAGRNTAQARALCTVDDREIIAVSGAFGERPHFHQSGQWAEMPSVRPPEDCEPRRLREDHETSIMSRIEMRLANARDWADLDGTPGDGRASLWARVPEVLDMSAASLAILGDYVPFGIGQTLGLPAGGNSLDNSLRVVRLVPTDWVLVDIRVSGVRDGFGHGLVHLWATDGTLLATGSQSVIVRYWGGSEQAAMELSEGFRQRS
ncbi:MAG TPA: acyl-CoA thioesterase domain-containing protein [Acidimicrobiales bacterium]